MRAAVAEISSGYVRKSSPDQTTKDAWAQLVRRRFHGQNLVKRCMADWELTEGQARGLVYAQATQPTIDHIIKRDPIEGFALSLEITTTVTGVRLEEYFEHKAKESRRGIAEWEAEERRLETLAALDRERRSFAGRGAE